MNIEGKFIVIEGLDGAGKSTAISFIREFLEQRNIVTKYTREPGGTKIAEEIRNLVLNNYDCEKLDPDAELLLMYASRMQHINKLIKPCLKKGINIVSDRFYWSSIAYQGGGRNLDFKKLDALNINFIRDCEPDLIIYLDIDPLIGLQRAKKISNPDRIEKEGLEFFDKVRITFKKLVENCSYAIEIDSSIPLEKVRRNIYYKLNEHFSL